MLETVIAELGGPNSLWWLAGAYFSMVIGERVYYAVARRRDYDNKDALCSIGLNLMNSVIGLVVAVLLPLVTEYLMQRYRPGRKGRYGEIWVRRE